MQIKWAIPIALVLVSSVISAVSVSAHDEWRDTDAKAAVDVGLDPGHSIADVGAVGGGLKEYEITLPIALMVGRLLEKDALKVALSRSDERPLTDFSEPDPIEQIRLEQEARIKAVGKARIYVSIHFNGFGDPRVRGLEIYYNRDNHGLESKRLAGILKGELIAEIRNRTGYSMPDRGVKDDLWAGKPYGHFFSLRGDMPSVLVESMFLTNPYEASLLTRIDTQQALAKGIASGIAKYFKLEMQP